MNDNRAITKVRLKPGEVEIRWEEESKDVRERLDRSQDKPLPEFAAAMQALVPDVLHICQFEEEYGARMSIRGLSLSWKHEIMGACITAVVELDSTVSPLVVNTPHLPELPYSGQEGDSSPTLPPETVDRIRDVLRCALAYLDGERLIEQGELPLEPDGGDQ